MGSRRASSRSRPATGALPGIIDALEAACAGAIETLGPAHAETIEAVILLAKAHVQSRRMDAAEGQLERQLHHLADAGQGGSAFAARVRTLLGEVLLKADRSLDALALCEQALSTHRRYYARGAPDTLALNLLRATALVRIGRLDDARPVLSALLDRQASRSAPAVDFLQACWQLAYIESTAGKHAAAHALATRALALARRRHGPEHLHTAKAYAVLAMTALDANDNSTAARHARRAQAIYAELGMQDLSGAETVRDILARAAAPAEPRT